MLFKIIKFYKKYWNELKDTTQHYIEWVIIQQQKIEWKKIFLVAGVQETE